MLLSIASFSQKVEFGEVSIAELEEKEYPNDPSAHAAVLFKNQDTYFHSGAGLNVITEIHERIKIYDKDGFDYVTESIRLFKSGSAREKITKIKAQTYNLVDGNIVISEIDKDQIFDNELSENYRETKFTLPDVKVGSVIEFSYKVTSPFYTNIDEFRFQYAIPIKRVHAEIRTPKGVTFKQMFKGFIPIKTDRSESMDHRLGMTVVIDQFDLENVPALKKESFVDNLNNYSSGVLFELVSIELGTSFKSYAQTWGDVAKTLGSEDDYKKEMTKTKVFEDEVDALLTDVTLPLEKTKLIFNYVKDQVEWNGMDGKYFYNGFKKCLEEKKGNTADINLMLVSMLRYAGIAANPVVISTKDNMVPYFPTVDRLNSVIAYAEIDGQNYFMDATEEFSDLNLLPTRDYNWKGILIDNEKMQWRLIQLEEPEKTQNMTMIQAVLNENGELEGTYSSRYSNHRAIDFRKEYNKSDLESYIKKIESDFDNIEISNYEAKNTDTHEGYVTQKFDFYYESASEAVSDKIYIKPLAFLKMTSNPFSEESRTYPIDFGYPWKNINTISITLPEGYKVESMPEPVLMQLPKGIGEYKFLIRPVANTIQLTSSSEINMTKVGIEDYDFLQKYFSEMVTKQSEQVILSKS